MENKKIETDRHMLRLPKINIYGGQPVVFAQVKMDGWYLEVFRDATPRAYFKSRTEEVFEKLPVTIRAAILRLPVGTVLRGELHAPGQAATEVPRLLRAADPRLVLTVFEVPSLTATDFDRPREWVEAAGLGFVETIRVSDAPAPVDGDAWFVAARQRGIEGWVFKTHHGDDGYKHKPLRTADVEVVGYSRSTSASFCGGLKSFDVAIEGQIVAAVVQGLDNAFRLTADPQRWVGRVMEVAFLSVTAGGKLQQPRFVRWREDKLPDQCRLDQLVA